MADLTHVPQIHQTQQEQDARMQWFRDARFGMFIHWGPCTIGDREIGWGRHATRPWDVNEHGPRGEDVDYDNYYKTFNPVQYDPDAWVTLARECGMKYMVLITKHHDGFCQFVTESTDHSIGHTPYGRDIVKEFVDACHRQGMRVGLYYSTRDWWHTDYMVGDNKAYDAYYRGHIEHLLSEYGPIDVMWFDHVGGQDWGRWDFEALFETIYRLQPNILVNNRAARFCGPRTPEDVGPSSPEVARMTLGDFETPEQVIGAMDLERDWESCMILSETPEGDGWSYRSTGVTRPLDECIRMLVSTAAGGGNLLLNLGPDPLGALRPSEIEIIKGMGAWLEGRGDSIYGTGGGPFRNGTWGGSTHKGATVYVHSFDPSQAEFKLGPLPQRVVAARMFPGGEPVSVVQRAHSIALSGIAPGAGPVNSIELTLDRPVDRGQVTRGKAD